ncbi:mechanosensitive ion channel family protein [Dehalococcoidia bacterium]|nr:mechanosensitive ion channel family protein [Dehalococcoidia bacterium]
MTEIIMNLDWDWFLAQGIWIVATIVVAALVYGALRRWAPRWITALITRITPAGEDWSRASRILNQVVQWTGTVVIVGAMVLVILPRLGVDIAWATDALKDAGVAVLIWLRGRGVRVAVILALAFAVQQIVRGMIPKIVHRSVFRKGKERFAEEVEQRAETLSNFLVGAAVVAIWSVTVFMILPEFGIQIGPLLAGAGIIGIAIGFGAQGLIRDILSGLFIIIEDQYSKGDWVQIAGIVGEVEYLGLRITRLRDLDGTSHVIPNGEVKIASNLTKDWARVNMIISVGYGEDLDRVSEVINRVSREMTAETYWRGLIMETPQVLRVDNLGDSGIDIKILGKTRPLKQWEVMGELRKRIKKTFDEEGIEIPWPHIKLYFGESPATDVLSKLEAQLSSGSKTKRRGGPNPKRG